MQQGHREQMVREIDEAGALDRIGMDVDRATRMRLRETLVGVEGVGDNA